MYYCSYPWPCYNNYPYSVLPDGGTVLHHKSMTTNGLVWYEKPSMLILFINCYAEQEQDFRFLDRWLPQGCAQVVGRRSRFLMIC